MLVGYESNAMNEIACEVETPEKGAAIRVDGGDGHFAMID